MSDSELVIKSLNSSEQRLLLLEDTMSDSFNGMKPNTLLYCVSLHIVNKFSCRYQCKPAFALGTLLIAESGFEYEHCEDSTYKMCFVSIY